MSTLDAEDRLYLEALLEPMKQSIKRHEKALFGNGQIGLVERVTQRDGTLGLHAARISDLEQQEHTHRPRERVTVAGLTTVVAGAVAAIIAALKP